MRTLRHKKVKWVAQGHKARKWWGWDLSSGSLASEPMLFKWKKLNRPTSVHRAAPCQVFLGPGRNEEPCLSSVGSHLEKSFWGDADSSSGRHFPPATTLREGRRGPALPYDEQDKPVEEVLGGGLRPSKLRVKIGHRLKNSLLSQGTRWPCQNLSFSELSFSFM